MKRLAIVTTHPVQYNAPLFKMLAERKNLLVKVFYTWGETCMENKFDPGFNRVVSWDISLLEGYSYLYLENAAKEKGSHHYKGIDNPSIIKTIELFQPDAILVYGWNFKSHLKLLRYFHKKVKIIFRGDSTLLDRNFFLWSAMRQLFLRWVYMHVDKALYVGVENKRYYIKYGLKESQLLFAPHAVDNSRFNFAAEFQDNNTNYRQLLGIADDEIVFLFVGKFEKKKSPGILLKAFKELKGKNHLVFAGAGELERELKEQSKDLKNVHFMGFVNQSKIPFVYQMCDVFVLPSSGPGETWGLSVNEAMASGKAVIVSNKCGCATDLVKEGLNGYVFSGGSVQNLKEKLELMQDKSKIAAFGAESAKMIKEYSFENICKAIEKI